MRYLCLLICLFPALSIAQIHWQEDFSNGLTSTNGNWTVSGPNPIWKHSFFGTSGEWSMSSPAPGFSSNSNGFMLYDADSLNALFSPNYINPTGELVSPTINLMSATSVMLQFESYMRHCCTANNGDIIVSVSIDGGVTWTNFDAVEGLGPNDHSTNPDLKEYNISALAAGQSNVRLKFTFNPNGSFSHYFWAIDDIVLQAVPDNDMAIISTNYADSSAGVCFTGLEYTVFPSSQIQNLNFGATLENKGVLDQSNVELNIDIDNGSGSVHNATSVSITNFTANTTQYVSIPGGFMPSQVGNYDLTYTVSQTQVDDVPIDNVVTRTLEVSDSVYARDQGPAISGVFNGTNNPYTMGNFFGMLNNQVQVTSISVYIDSATDIGAIAVPKLFGVDGTGNFVLLYDGAGVTAHTIVSADLGSWITMPIHLPVNLTAYQCVGAFIEHFGGNDLVLGTNGSAPPQTSFLYDPNSGPTWFYLTALPMIRMNINNQFALNVSETQSIDCNGHCNGELSANAFGGSFSYTYQWYDGTMTPIAGANSSLLNGLCAGTYYVAVDDGTGNADTASYVLTEPSQVVLTMPNATNLQCSGNCDGEISFVGMISGGTSPYSFTIDGGATYIQDSIFSNLCVGTYGCLVEDSLGCATTLYPISLTAVNTISIAVSGVDETCLNACDGEVGVNVMGGTAPITTDWIDITTSMSVGTSDTLSNLCSGTYEVTVTDAAACVLIDTVEVSAPPAPDTVDICFVTSSIGNNSNIVIWEKPVSSIGLDSFMVYREVSGTFQLIHAQAYADSSKYEDLGANPTTSPHKYAITVKDSCGLESGLSPAHETIFLQGMTFGGAVGLIWTPYVGAPIPKYYIYRDTMANGSWVLHDSVNSVTTNYMDWSPASNPATAYQIRVFKTLPCLVTRANDFNWILSNVIEGPYPVDVETQESLSLNVYPNPNDGVFRIEMDHSIVDGTLRIYNALGAVIHESILGKEDTVQEVNMKDAAPGIYFIVWQNQHHSMSKRVVVR